MTGGNSASSMMEGPGLPGPGVSGSKSGCGGGSGDDGDGSDGGGGGDSGGGDDGDKGCGGSSDSFSGLVCCGMLADLMRVSVFGVIDCPANGDAMTTVPAVAMGAGCGLVDRNRGWINVSVGGSEVDWLSTELIMGWLTCLEVGREKLGGLDGGDDILAFGELGGPQLSTAVAASDEAPYGESGRKGPSSALAGDSGLLPGIVSKPDLVTGGVDCNVVRTSRVTPDVSQWSKG